MGKVLFVTRIFRGELFGDIAGFQERNWDVKILTSPSGCSSWNIPARIKAKLKLDISSDIEKERITFEKKVKMTAEEFQPDIIYVCHGTQLSPDTLDKMRQKYYMFLELSDRLCFWPETYNTCTHYHLCVTYSKEDSEYINNIGGNCIYLKPVSKVTYAEKLNVPKDIDVFFAGALTPESDYGDRFQMLKRLMRECPNIKLMVAGQFATWKMPKAYLEWLTDRKFRKTFINKNVTRKECNELYNRSKICLTINRINTGNTWSDRLGVIMQTGSFQLATWNETIEKNFTGMLDTFKNYEEMKEKVLFYLKHDELREEIAKKGFLAYQQMIKGEGEELDYTKLAEIVIRSFEKQT